MRILQRCIMVCLQLLLLCTYGFAGRSVWQKQIGDREVEVELDPYYSNVSFYQPIAAGAIPCLTEENELKIYKHLLLSPVPRYLMLELSTNPLPWTGVFIRKNEPVLYERSRVNSSLNLIQAVCAGYEEPYAGSVFLGNVVSFVPRGSAGCAGKGYIGVLVSGGNYHIQDCTLIEDDWTKGEVRFEGDKTSPERKINWSVRFGIKEHHNQYIRDVYYCTIKRNRADFTDNALSFFKNSAIEYTADIDRLSGKFIRHSFRIGKKLAVTRFKFTIGMNTGFIWEGADKYTGPLERPHGEEIQILLQPDIMF